MSDKLSWKTWIKQKLSEIAMQILIVVLSISLALTVDEWKTTRAKRELAHQAIESVISELTANKKELESGIVPNDSILTEISKNLSYGKTLQGGIPFSYVQLSSAAWQTAQGTQALHLIDFSKLIKIAQVYEFQSLYNSSQSKFVNELGESWLGGKQEELKKIQRKGAIQLALICQLAHELSKQYSSIIADSTTLKLK